MLLFDYNIC